MARNINIQVMDSFPNRAYVEIGRVDKTYKKSAKAKDIDTTCAACLNEALRSLSGHDTIPRGCQVALVGSHHWEEESGRSTLGSELRAGAGYLARRTGKSAVKKGVSAVSGKLGGKISDAKHNAPDLKWKLKILVSGTFIYYGG